MEQQTVIDKFQAFVAVEGDTLMRLLFWAEQTVTQRLLAQLEAMGYANVSLAELRLMQQLCLAGVRLTELADRMKLSKQAIGQLIDSLERKQWVMRSPDPQDKRAKIIAYTTQGYQFIADTIDATFIVEQELSQ
ncbi:MAG: MarR family transcriptional regulator, partial [Kamptonema sp. SIO4C4]|nr:MarR family transcriptional regulator [Kamptonema sp. SIO4C4]